MEGDQSLDNPSPTTLAPTTPVPPTRKEPVPDTPSEKQPDAVMVAPVPLPRQNLPPKRPEDLGDKHEDEVLLESESEASTKTSCSDSGIEDGKSSPTSEEKV